MDSSHVSPVGYKTHILIGRTSDGKMTVLGEWPHVPQQSEVQKKIDQNRDSYVTYLLCTPTSIMQADGNGGSRRLGPSRYR
jgi:hypothetical protein